MDGLSAAQRARVRRRTTLNEESEQGELNVVPFLDILVNVMMFVLATLTVTFTTSIDTKPIATKPRAAEVHPLGLTVLIVHDGFSVKASGGNVAPGCANLGEGLAVPRGGDGYDFDALTRCVDRVKGTSDELSVALSADANIPYATVIETMDALRLRPDGSPLFPDVALAIAR